MPRIDSEARKDIKELTSRLDAIQPRVDTLFQQNENLLNNPWVPQGSWAASTNTPTLANADAADSGSSYLASDAGSVDFGAGSISFVGGDLVSKNAAGVWFKSAGIGSVLAGVATVADARTTLGVYSKQEINNRVLTQQTSNGALLDGVASLLSCGDSALVSFGDAINDSPFSLAAVIRPDSLSSDFEIIAKANANFFFEYRFWVGSSDNKLRCVIYDNAVGAYIGVVGSTALVEGETYHVAMTYNGDASGYTDFKLYVNSVAETAADNSAGAYTAMHDTTTPLQIGYSKPSANSYAKGVIRSALVYKRELTAAEVLDLFEDGNVPAVADQWGNNTSVFTGDSSNFTSGLGNWTEEGSTTLTVVQSAGKMVITDTTSATGTRGARNLVDTLDQGQWYRVTFKTQATTGSGVIALRDYNAASFEYRNATSAFSSSSGSGTEAEFTPTASETTESIEVKFTNGGAAQILLRMETATADGDVFSFDDFTVIPVGAVVALLPENIDVDGNWNDATSNNLNASGTSVTSLRNPKRLSFNTDGRAADDVIIDVDNFDVQAGGDVKVRQLRAGLAEAVTIATGAITITGSTATVDTESVAGTDDLDTINGGEANALLVLRAANDSRTVVCKDGTGNLALAGDFSLTHTHDRIVLQYDSALSLWVEISRSDNNT